MMFLPFALLIDAAQRVAENGKDVAPVIAAQAVDGNVEMMIVRGAMIFTTATSLIRWVVIDGINVASDIRRRVHEEKGRQ